MESFANLPVVLFESKEAWHDWLHTNHSQPTGLWLKIAKKGSGKSSVSYLDALEDALCYGWIDGQKQKYDDEYWLQKFTPRGPKSDWSKVNVEKAEGLILAGKMQAAGLAAIQAGKDYGSWHRAYHSQSSMEMPADFMSALGASPEAKRFFYSLTKSKKYPFYYRVVSAKKPETRVARIKQFVEMLEKGETFHSVMQNKKS